MEGKEILTSLIDSKKSAILKVLLNSSEEMYLKEISEKSQVSIASTFRILQDLVEMKIILKRQWKTSKVYKVEENKTVEFLQKFFKEEFDGVQVFFEAVKDLPNVDSIIAYNAQKNKASILLIGKNIESEMLDKKSEELKSKGFELHYLTLTKPQYEQMLKMGLYAGEKRVLK